MTSVLPFNTIQRLELPLSEIVSGRIGFIHDLFLCFPYEICDKLPTGNKDLVVITGKDNRSDKLRQLGEYQGRVLLVLAPGDASFRASYMPGRLGLPPNVTAAFVTSNEHADRRAINVPLGVRHNKLRPLQFVRQNHAGGRDRLLYGNFTVNDDYSRGRKESSHIRTTVVEHLAGEPWATLDVSSIQRDTPDALIRYYSEISRHRFMVSPEGSGIDCYRTWESLYLGTIPIVMVSPATTTFAGLPILFTENYNELSRDYLERRWQEMSARNYDISGLFKSYYRQQFLEHVASLTHPRFVCWGFKDTDNEKFHQVLGLSSRSPTNVIAETPRRPFAPPGLKLTDPSSWSARSGVELTASGPAIRLRTATAGPGSAKFPLETISGGPFRLSGRVRGEPGDSLPLSIVATDKSHVSATWEAPAGAETELIFEFVATADRTWLVIKVPASSTWLISDLEVSATV